MDGVPVRELERAVDLDLGITRMAHALALHRRALEIGGTATCTVGCVDLLGSALCTANSQT